MTMPEQLYLPKQLIGADYDVEDVVAPPRTASWSQRLLAAVIVLRSRQARAILESRGHVRQQTPGALRRR